LNFLVEIWAALVNVMVFGIDYFYALFGNYGLSIIAVTIIVRVFLFPFTFSQMRSMKKMQDLQPEIKKLEKKYKDDPQAKNTETWKLWQEHGVNPLMGCLPLLVQFPFIIAFFRALEAFQYSTVPTFLWLTPAISGSDLSVPDPWFILPVLAAVATFLQTKLTTTATVDPTSKATQWMMPLFIGWFSTRFPAALALYWVISSGIGVIQQVIINRLVA